MRGKEGTMALNKLTQLKLDKGLKRPGIYGDGGGLYVDVRRAGNRSWVFRYKIGGRMRWLGLGPLHTVSLAEARVRARAARQLLVDGKDPLEVKREAAIATHVAQLKTMTFAEAVDRFLATDKIEALTNDQHRRQWRTTLERVFPAMGHLPLQQISTVVILKAITPIWKKTPETGSRLRSRIERVFDWAKPLELYPGTNPATWDVLKDHLPAKPKPKHHAAMPWANVPAFMQQLRDRNSVSARALEFLILTAARTGEVIGMRCAEIDLDARVWTVPAERMKAKVEHKVPLSDRAIEILNDLPRKSGESIFPLSNMAMLELLKGMAGNGYTTHGFRSAFRDWCGERTNFARDIIEFALAHKLPNKVEASYRRETAVEKRRPLMQAWAKYCASPSIPAGEVVSLHA
jgi:integrase